MDQILFQLTDERLCALRDGIVEGSRASTIKVVDVVDSLPCHVQLRLHALQFSFGVLGRHFKVTGHTLRVSGTHLGLDRPLLDRREPVLTLLQRAPQVLDLGTPVRNGRLQGLYLALAVLSLRKAPIELLLLGVQVDPKVANLVHRGSELPVHHVQPVAHAGALLGQITSLHRQRLGLG